MYIFGEVALAGMFRNETPSLYNAGYKSKILFIKVIYGRIFLWMFYCWNILDDIVVIRR